MREVAQSIEPETYEGRSDAKEGDVTQTNRRLHRDDGLSSRFEAARGTGMDLRNQVGWLSP
jgi:hypothetical protein